MQSESSKTDQVSRDYFSRRNQKIVERLLSGDNPRKIAAEYDTSVEFVEHLFPPCNYRIFCVSVKRRFALGETSFEISKAFSVPHEMVLSVLGMSYKKEARLFSIMRMHDNGFSISDICEFTALKKNIVLDILDKVGRNQSRMPFYPLLKEFKMDVDDNHWFERLCDKITEAKQPGYRMTVENEIEQKYQQKFKEMYTKFVQDELGELPQKKGDEAYAEKLLKSMSRLKGVSQQKLIVLALVEYGKKLGLKEQKQAWGGKHLTRAKAVMQRQVDEHYVELEELKNTDADEANSLIVEEYDKGNPMATKEHYSFLPDYLKE